MESVYRLEEQKEKEGLLQSQIRIQWPHPVFDGHFPGHPVVPGVLMLSMLEHALTETVNQHIELIHANFIKFVNLWNPRVYASAYLQLRYMVRLDVIHVQQAVIGNGDVPFFKFKGKFHVRG